MKAIEILKHYSNSVSPVVFTPKVIMEAIKELQEIEKDKEKAQILFIQQDLKYKEEIKKLKIKFIEDMAFLKKEIE